MVNLALPWDISPSVMPVIYEIYAGINGKMHGDKKDKIPAANAKSKETWFKWYHPPKSYNIIYWS